MGTIHGPWGRAFEVDSLGVVPTTVARTLELLLALDPVRSTSQVSAYSQYDEKPFAVTNYPDAMFLLKPSVDPGTEIAGIADLERCLRFEQNAGEEKPQCHKQVRTQKSKDTRPSEVPPAHEPLLFLGIFVLGSFCNLLFGHVSYARKYLDTLTSSLEKRARNPCC